MKRLALVILLLGLILVGCNGAGASPEADSDEAATEEPTEEPTASPTETSTATPTDEPTATHTQPFTRTPLPSRTPTATDEPTATDVPATQAPAASNTPSGDPASATATTETVGDTPTPIIAVTSMPTTETQPSATPTTETVAEHLPQGQSVWQLDTVPYEYFSTEACGEPIYNDFYGLVAVESVQGGLNWTRQDGITYFLGWTAPNTYWGSGVSMFEGLSLQISVFLSGPENMSVTYTLADNANADCRHVFRYGAFRAW